MITFDDLDEAAAPRGGKQLPMVGVVLWRGVTYCAVYAESVEFRSPGQAYVSATNVRAALGCGSTQGIGRASDVATDGTLPRPKPKRSAGAFAVGTLRIDRPW